MRVLRISHSAVVSEWRERERALRRSGFEVLVLSAHRWREGGQEVELAADPGEDVLGVRTWGRHPALFVYDPRPLWRLLGESWSVLDIHEEPYALATAEILLIRALRRARTPYLLYSAQNIAKRYPWPFSLLERLALRHAAGVQTCNSDAARIVSRKGFPGRVEVIPLGVDLARHEPRPGPARSATRIGFAGRLDQHKGLDVLLRAITRLPDRTLVVAGDGPERARLHALAGKLGIADRVIWHGALPADRMPQFYRGIDALVVPSLDTDRWREQFGRVAVEAMAAGVPVVATRAGALPEVVADAGVLVPQHDAPAIAAAIERLDDPDTVRTLRAAGTARARGCDWVAVAERFAQLYRRVAPEPVRDRPDLLVLVVAYGDPGPLARCLESLRAGGWPVDITVVDNGTDERARHLAEAAGATYLSPGRNLGYPAAVNLGMKAAPGRDVLLVNPDAVVTPDQARALHRVLADDPRVAACAPAQQDPDGTPVRVGWPWPSPLTTWLDAVGLGRHRRPRYVTGAVLLLRAEALAQVGGFDETFFLYGEEADWERRATRMGWTIRLVPEVTVTHIGAASSADRRRRDIHFDAAQERYLRAHSGAAGWQVARAAVLAGAALRWIASPRRRPEMRRRWASYVRGPLRQEWALRPDPT